MSSLMILRGKKDDIHRIVQKYGGRNVRVFGSVARNEQQQTSDIDILVDMEEGRTGFDLGGMLIELEELLGQKVDLVTEKGLSPYIRDAVLKDAVGL